MDLLEKSLLLGKIKNAVIASCLLLAVFFWIGFMFSFMGEIHEFVFSTIGVNVEGGS